MMKYCKKKLKKYKNQLREQLTSNLKENKINSYSDLLKITSDALNIRVFNKNIVEYKNYEHVMLLVNFGASHEDYIMTYIYDYHSSGKSVLSVILSGDNEDEKVNSLLKECEVLLDHMITPYINDIQEFKNKHMK